MRDPSEVEEEVVEAGLMCQMESRDGRRPDYRIVMKNKSYE